jgi:predicted nucleotidyltransferase
MLSERNRNTAEIFKQRLNMIIPVLDLRVFGSCARGEDDEESDLDFFIEVNSITLELRQRISELAWEIGFQMGQLIFTVIITKSQLDEGAMGASPLILHIQKEGVQL